MENSMRMIIIIYSGRKKSTSENTGRGVCVRIDKVGQESGADETFRHVIMPRHVSGSKGK